MPEFPDKSDPNLLAVEIEPGKVHYFQQDRPGVLPSVLRSVLAERKKVKREMKQETGMMRAILNAKQVSWMAGCSLYFFKSLSVSVLTRHSLTQMALKVVANGSYGYCGRKSGEMLCPAISETTTYFGRQLIDMTIKDVQKYFGAEARPIYGDTDSVMSLTPFANEDLAKAWELGERMEKHFNEVTFGAYPSIVMELEKSMAPYILFKVSYLSARAMATCSLYMLSCLSSSIEPPSFLTRHFLVAILFLSLPTIVFAYLCLEYL